MKKTLKSPLKENKVRDYYSKQAILLDKKIKAFA